MNEKKDFIGLIALKDPYDIYDALYVLVKDERLFNFLGEKVDFAKGFSKIVRVPVIGGDMTVSIGSPDNDKAIELVSREYDSTDEDFPLKAILKINGRSIDNFYESYLKDDDEADIVEMTDELFDNAVEKIMSEHHIKRGNVYEGLIY